MMGYLFMNKPKLYSKDDANNEWLSVDEKPKPYSKDSINEWLSIYEQN